MALHTAPNEKSIQEERTQRDASNPESTAELPQEMSAFQAYKRIFRNSSSIDSVLQGVGSVAAAASGVGIAMQTLIFGSFITTMNDFTAGRSSASKFREDAGDLALYFVYLGIVRFVLSYTYNLLFTYTAHRTTRNIRLGFLRAALRQEVAFHDVDTGGSIATQATSNGRLIQGGTSEKLGLAFQGISAFIAAFIVAFVVQWKLTLICLCIAPTTLLIMGIVSGMQAGLMIKSIGIYMRSNSFVEGVLGSVRAVHAFEMRERLVQKFSDHLKEGRHVGKRLSPLLGVMFSSQFTIIQLGFGLAFWQGIHMLARGEIEDSGKIFTVLMSIILASTNLTSLAPHFVDFSQAASAAAKLFSLIDRTSQIDPFSTAGERLSEINGGLELQNVRFAYPNRPNTTVLHDFSLVIPAGKVTALVEPVLFRGTIFDNIKQGLVGTQWEHSSRDQQLEQVQKAAKIAFAHDFISELPDGYETEIGQRGGLLSGGQRQRIAIARSVVSGPKILLLDEATSALDPHAEAIVQQALDRASEGRTTIVIAHKLATIRKADNIVVMSKGRIVEQGTHDSLIANNDVYAKLVRIQDLTVGVNTDQESTTTTDKESDIDAAAGANTGVEIHKQLTRYPSSVQEQMEKKRDRYDYDLHKQMGILAVIYRLVKETPGATWSYIFATLGVLGGATAYPAQAILMSKVVTIFNFPEPVLMERGDFFSSMFIVLAAGCLLSYFSLGYSTNNIAQQLNYKYRKQVFHDIIHQDIQFFDRPENSTGALTSRADSCPQSILELMGFNIAMISISVLNLAACSILALAYSWKLGLVVVLAGLPPTVSVGFIKIRFDAKLDRDNAKRYSNSAAIASEAVTAIRTVSSLAIETSVLSQYVAELDHAVSESKSPLCQLMIWFALMQAMEYWFMALGFWYGCRLVSSNEVDLGAFLIAFLSVFFAGQASSALFQFSTSITKGVNAANYVFWLHSLQPATSIRPTAENQAHGPNGGDCVEFNNVRFSYPLRPEMPVLRGVNLKVKKGQFVAFVGASGCGKSTMIGMLERFYDTSTGSIAIDESALPDLNPRLYRRIAALVPQEPALFDGSIRENIAFGIDDPEQERTTSPAEFTTRIPDAIIEDALRSANAWDFVSSLPEGLNTDVGSNGSQLSGGQRQRIAIARALVRNPKILLLDEATSALDTESEKIVQNALDAAAKAGNRITVAVAHRLSTIKDADVICVFFRGKIAEVGTHAELLARGGIYQSMCEAQSLS
ncbi:hypothetical protein Daus18300_002535 [Diaporthe australafricana]|uniref:Leptomycin B resistance protein pmd1 n=1 Tax=Diaporthe australafricana TaxID=127596 RepID=A0ABR3XMK9_9PEZI